MKNLKYLAPTFNVSLINILIHSISTVKYRPKGHKRAGKQERSSSRKYKNKC